MSWRAFSAKSGQLEAGSTTTGSIFMPMTPPLALISSIAMSATSLRTVSLIAIVPESEWRMPTLTVFCCANALGVPIAAIEAASASTLTNERRFMILPVGWKTTSRELHGPCHDQESGSEPDFLRRSGELGKSGSDPDFWCALV